MVVKEPVDRFLGNGPVGVALPPAVVGELAQHPFLDFERYPPGTSYYLRLTTESYPHITARTSNDPASTTRL